MVDDPRHGYYGTSLPCTKSVITLPVRIVSANQMDKQVRQTLCRPDVTEEDLDTCQCIDVIAMYIRPASDKYGPPGRHRRGPVPVPTT